MSSPFEEFSRTKVQDAYGKEEISDEVWDEVTKMNVWSHVTSIHQAVTLIREHVAFKKSKAEKQKRIDEMEKRIAEIQAEMDQQQEINRKKRLEEQQKRRRQLSEQEKRQLFVSNVSEAANDSEFLETFRSRQVAERTRRGGFVSHKMFIEFVKAAHLMTNGDESRNEQVKTLKRTMDKVQSEMDTQYGRIISQRVPNSLFPTEYSGDKDLQSALAAAMLQFAVRKLQQSQTDAGVLPKICPSMIVSHRFVVVSTVDRESTDIMEHPKEEHPNKKKAKLSSSDETNNNNDSQTCPTQQSQQSKKERVAFRPDILCWFTHRVPEMGSCCLASVAFNADFDESNDPKREATADMCASNIQILHHKPCLRVDIACGTDISSWIISIHALVKREFPHRKIQKKPLWEKSLLYRGSGTAAFVRVASGLLAALVHYPETMQDFGMRLGPVVGLVDGKVFKAYDHHSSTSGKPNIDLIREFVDEKAQLWTSDEEENDEKLAIVEMCYHESKWDDATSVTSFISILEQLQKLHGKGLVHGDIRLLNLLSTGHIVDFDFVGLEHYPEGLNHLTTDGSRHKEVDHAIVFERVHLLKPVKEHDTYSMAQVMKLFQVEVEGQSWWEEATMEVENGNLDAAIEILRNHENNVAHLKEDVRL
ncbi:hypothetical protein IV203_028084 [Nitzschia inconspicua]|uniref:Protein kinase domain-containing protein n=1 Tax=Nitzschia inconspicua TaxID=303405 RepID=A0A9K3LYG0_9STRA|nr:hypothetical protein IV203_028084 [Nitzschia inconspicua]